MHVKTSQASPREIYLVSGNQNLAYSLNGILKLYTATIQQVLLSRLMGTQPSH